MPPVRITDDKFCIAVLGDFLGEGSGFPRSTDVTWNPRPANPDSVFGLTGLKPRIRVAVGEDGEVEEVEFSNLESFEPDALFERLPLFAALREARDAAKEGRPYQGSGGEPERLGEVEGSVGLKSAPQPPPVDGSSVLDAILDQAQPQSSDELPRTQEELEAFVRDVVRPHLVREDTDLPTRVAAVDEEIGTRMSRLLHSGEFQRLEAIWRSLVLLLSRIDTTGKIRVYLVHLPREELERDLLEGGDPMRSKLHGLLSAPQLGVPGRKWAAVIGAYGFEARPEEVRLLGQIARVAWAADVPWVSSFQAGASGDEGSKARDALAGLEEWTRFRERPESAWLGLTYPRFLAREPYCGSSRRVKVFDFREQADSRSNLLWGHGAFLCVALLAQGFGAEEWGFRVEDRLSLEGMPLAEVEAETGMSPMSVEKRLDLPMARDLAGAGIIPILGYPERAEVRVGGLHSVAASGAPLRAWWKR